MSINDKLAQQLVEHGLWPHEAQAVMTELKAHKSSAAMQGRWDDDAEFQTHLIAVLLISAKTQAIKWIDRNAPQHFARSNLDA